MIKNDIDNWLHRIEQELPKSKTLGDLMINNGLYQSNGIEAERPSNSSSFLQYPEWRILSKAHSNEDLLKSLTYGAEAILINTDEMTDDLLDDVRLDYVQSLFIGSQGYTLQEKQLINYPKKPSIIVSEVTYEINSSLPDSLLAFFDFLKLKFSEADSLMNVLVTIHIDNDFYKTINLLRAVRIAFANLNKALGAEHTLKIICTPIPTTSDFNRGLIYCSMSALASIIGGADYIYLMEWNKNEGEARLCQNILHLLREESSVSLFHDPTSGSYFFENATHQIVEKIWSSLVK
jgi:hypothetical protein